MKISAVAIVGGLATLASADSHGNDYKPTKSECSTQSAPSAVTTHKVVVGAAGQLIYSPNQVEAAVGDVVEFDFLALNHTLTQSDFNTPCTANGGFTTGFNQFNPKNESGAFVRTFTVTDTKPKWFYCGFGNHCQRGMVFGINPAGKMDEFIEKAKASGNDNPATNPVTPAPPVTPVVPVNGGDAPPTTGADDAIATVIVGLEGGKRLVFDPPYLMNKRRGARIHFDFRAQSHTLTESTFEEPCKKIANARVDTDFNNVNPEDRPNFKPFDITLDTDVDVPRWFYCKAFNGQANGHCAKGMVFAINPKSEEQFQEFLAKAQATILKIKGRGLELGEMA